MSSDFAHNRFALFIGDPFAVRGLAYVVAWRERVSKDLILLLMKGKYFYCWMVYIRRRALFQTTGAEYRRYFQHAHFIPLVSVGKRGAY